MLRTVIVGLLAALLSLSAFSAAPVRADRALPKRIITEVPPDAKQQVDFNAFKLNGTVTEPQADPAVAPVPYLGKVQLQKKACKACNWRTVKKVKTDETGKYRTKIFVPQKGVWKWRVKVKASNGYGTTKGEIWTAAFE
ncbi:hypothetical protein [Nocardioides sp. B-3]|uniref:hypothetical protein n=1 Tax=Nocardioides sp. B-3 TaxID=2895565 RepID=UPI002152143E|nr:hypothetical protein [Nocardioides sp. B-3]UUZ60734.1 hypothetical protein LP418_08060 [Nocardioides sp. B-3]